MHLGVESLAITSIFALSTRSLSSRFHGLRQSPVSSGNDIFLNLKLSSFPCIVEQLTLSDEDEDID